MIDRSLLEACAERTTVMPTQATARQFQLDYAALQIEQGLTSWETPEIYSWSVFLKKLYQECLQRTDSIPALLNERQHAYLWQRIIRSSKAGNRLLNPGATTRQALSAYKLCCDWQIPLLEFDQPLNVDAFAFKQWYESYQLKLRSLESCDGNTLAEILLSHPDILRQVLKHVVFVAFDEMTPQQDHFIKCLSEFGVNVRIEKIDNQNVSCKHIVGQDLRQEIKFAADWVKDHLKQNSQKRLGIVVSDLQSKRELIERELDRELGIHQLLDSNGNGPPVFNISLGVSLFTFPMIEHAFVVFKLMNEKITIDDVSHFLNSPFIEGWQQEADIRALLDKNIRKQGVMNTSREFLRTIITESKLPCPVLLDIFSRMDSLKGQQKGKQSIKYWAEKVTEILKSVGWPGDASLDSDEFQTLKTWQNALREFVSLHALVDECYFNESILHLKNILTQTRFQPETGQSPVTVLSHQAVSGMGFDALWILGMDDQTWPSYSHSNPFIPLTLQKEAGISSATPELNLSKSRNELNSMIKVTPDVVMSYSRKLRDQDLRPSPLIYEFSQGIFESELTIDNYLTIFQSGKCEFLHELQVAGIDLEKQVTGGSKLFQDQSACPFRAFARHRLYAEGVASPESGLDARTRGIILHRAMHTIWERLKYSDQLGHLSESALKNQISNAVDKAIAHYISRLPGYFAKELLELEVERQTKLIHEWLQLEKARKPFTVKATEKAQHVKFQDMTLQMQIDRIDENSDGTLTIIDYKMSDAKLSDWQGERMNQPQLPLYAVTQEGKIAACLFAKIKPGDFRFIGLADSEERVDGIKSPDDEDWQELLQAWEAQLTMLADEFKQGRADVLPKDETACRYCDLHVFCRIHERCENGIMNSEE